MNIYKYIIEKWFLFYKVFYIYSLPLLFILFWFWLSHVDRVHIRDKSKNIGLYINKYINTKISDSNKNVITKYFCSQINAIGEVTAGITDGMMNKKSSIEVKYIKNFYSQTENKSFCNIEIQTINTNSIDKETQTNIKDNENETTYIEKIYIEPKKIFTTAKKNVIDTEILKEDLENDKKTIFSKQKNKKISIIRVE